MGKQVAIGSHKPKSQGHEFIIDLLTYYEPDENLYYAMSLSLDIVGAGATEQEAVGSFNEMLSDFIAFTSDRGTIASELMRMGWNVDLRDKKPLKAIVPTIEDLKKNPDWADIWAKNPQIGSCKVELAI